MSGCSEWGKCDYCEYEGPINRHYFRYDINCECCNDNHFEIVWHCDKCEPIDLGIRRIQLSEEEKHKIFNI
jgi:hypothetical protein